MKKQWGKLLALMLTVCLIFSGCALDFGGYFRNVGQLLLGQTLTHFEDMQYQRPDPEAMQAVVDECCGKVDSARNLDAVISLIYEVYDQVDSVSTAYVLANIYYCQDLTNEYWAQEYAYCSETAVLAQSALDQFYRALAQCRFREALEGEDYFGPDFFDNYDGEGVYDEVLTALMTQEAELESQYYALWNQARDLDPNSSGFMDTYGLEMEQLYVQLIRVRQEMARHLGYDSYPEFAYDFYYGRDYTCRQTTAYLADIRAELVPLYQQQLEDFAQLEMGESTEEETLAYLRNMAQGMGGTMAQAYDDMIRYGLYDIAYSPNKYEASFEVYIRGYYSPYLFINPTMTDYDKLTLAHEFGHFCCDYATSGSAAGVDVGEIFSQSMEYLSLCYGQDTQDLQQLKLLTGLATMVEQAAYASFEQQVYDLSAEDLTVENLRVLFGQVMQAYGLDGWDMDSRYYVQINHLYTNPMYVISYVVSNDVAMQLYQMEIAQSGSGVEKLEEIFFSADAGIVTFTETYGLESPFAQGRIRQLKDTLQQMLHG